MLRELAKLATKPAASTSEDALAVKTTILTRNTKGNRFDVGTVIRSRADGLYRMSENGALRRVGVVGKNEDGKLLVAPLRRLSKAEKKARKRGRQR